MNKPPLLVNGCGKFTFTAHNFWRDKQGNIVPDRRFHINVEMQKRANPGYAIVTRATYYCARLLSKQGEDKTALEVYKGLEKVYSIWICPFVAPERKNSISRYHVAEDCFEDLVEVQEERTHYELAEIIIVRLGRKPKATGNQTMDLLNLIFSSLPAEQKLEQMRDTYHITITQEIEEEVRTMSVLFQKVIEDATPEIEKKAIEEATPAIEKKAIEKNTLQILHNMVCNLGLSVERAMEAAGISANDRPYFASQLALF